MKDLSIIIVNTNNRPVIGPCLDSVFQFTAELDFEVIVADNGSTDGSLELLKSAYPQITLIENKANLGFSKANNRGMERAQGRAVILLNSDTELRDNVLKWLHDFLFSDPKIGACGGTLVYPGGAPQFSTGFYPSFPRMVMNTVWGILRASALQKARAVIPPDSGPPSQVEYVCGADLMMKKSVLDQVGLLDEQFFVYCEETDLCRRITQAGYEIWHLPEAKIVHHIEGSFRERKKMREIIFFTSLNRYLVKHYGYYRAAKYYMMAQFKIHQWLSARGSEAYEDAKFRYEVIKESALEYPFEF
jgi:GT2 family glycosyltransferase